MNEKIDYKHGKFVILTNIVDDDEFDQEEMDELNMNSVEYSAYCAERAAENFECDLYNIKTHKPWAVPVVVTGTLGLWWGHPEIKPERIESVYEAIQKCIGSDGDYVKVEFNDGKLDVQVSHHDGTNCFTIRALSKKGVQKKNGEYVARDFKRLNYLYA